MGHSRLSLATGLPQSCKSAPKEAWQEADLIDAVDFDHNPLLSLVPEYLTAMSHYYGDRTQNFSFSAIQYNDQDDDPEQIWMPHEKMLMMPMWGLPQTSSVFGETDYLVCKDFGKIYLNLRVPDRSKRGSYSG